MTTKIKRGDALIIVDPQVDFCPGGALAVEGGDEIMTSISALAREFREAGAVVVITQDWHPANQISFASQHSAEPFSTKQVSYGEQTMWPDHCVQGTPGAEFHPALDATLAQVIIRKGTNPLIDSYSAFTENDGVTTTGLGGYLDAMDVTRCFFVGLAYDYCVGYSALDAADDGFDAVVVRDLTRAINSESAGAMKWKLDEAGVVSMNSEDI